MFSGIWVPVENIGRISYLQIIHGKAEIAISVYLLFGVNLAFLLAHVAFLTTLCGDCDMAREKRQISHTEAELFTNQEIPCFLLVLLPSHHMHPHERWSGALSPNFWASTWNVEETSGRAAVPNDCTNCFVK